MMWRVFIDTNVILDVLLMNPGLWKECLQIFELAEHKGIDAYVSASSMTDIFYMVRKRQNIETARLAYRRILSIFSVVGVTQADLEEAYNIPISDIEDALQVQCATKMKADYIITRNIRDFKESSVQAILPGDFLKKLQETDGFSVT
jgi:predicted nucleic acid-binding protein